MSYNFPDTSPLPSISLGLCTRPFSTPVLGASSQKAKEGIKSLVLSVCSFPPSRPYPYVTFRVASLHVLSLFTMFAHCLHPNPSLLFPLFCREKFKFEPFQLVFCALFFVTGSPLSPLSPPHISLLCTYSTFFGPNCFCAPGHGTTGVVP